MVLAIFDKIGVKPQNCKKVPTWCYRQKNLKFWKSCNTGKGPFSTFINFGQFWPKNDQVPSFRYIRYLEFDRKTTFFDPFFDPFLTPNLTKIGPKIDSKLTQKMVDFWIYPENPDFDPFFTHFWLIFEPEIPRKWLHFHQKWCPKMGRKRVKNPEKPPFLTPFRTPYFRQYSVPQFYISLA